MTARFPLVLSPIGDPEELQVGDTLDAAALPAPSGVVTIRVVTAAGVVAVTSADGVIAINKTSGAPTTVNLEASPATGQVHTIKDAKGDAATNNITITPNSGTIDGASTAVLSNNFAAVSIVFDGTNWEIF